MRKGGPLVLVRGRRGDCGGGIGGHGEDEDDFAVRLVAPSGQTNGSGHAVVSHDERRAGNLLSRRACHHRGTGRA